MAHESPVFVGVGDAEAVAERTGRKPPEWQPLEDSHAERKATFADHPAGYIADRDLIAAVNTALLLGKPLLLAGNPGTGKTQLAERIAWELGLGAVLRFESQSISEAQDLFYRFDLVGQMARVQLLKAGLLEPTDGTQAASERKVSFGNSHLLKATEFLSFGPLGRAILRAGTADAARRELLRQAFPNSVIDETWVPRRSVVLIDEIDKASRDFPNDLLNAIERLEFRIRELPGRDGGLVRVPDDEALRPIVIITSNGEREIPTPFLRRCVFCHIADPTQETLRKIVVNRVFGDRTPEGLPLLYEQLLDVFDAFRGDEQAFAYRAGTSELVDWARAISRQRKARPEKNLKANREVVFDAASAVAKNRKDRERLVELLEAAVAKLPAES